MYYLSIISPFYNSEHKSHRLLSTLSNIKDRGVQIILVDDGSTDNTVTLLKELKQNSEIDVVVITQENKGPGGARNAGLKAAQGDYVWFVDSDDDIIVEALSEIQKKSEKKYDFIDFNYNTNGISTNSMEFNPGVYKIDHSNRSVLLTRFGRIWTKVFRRNFIIANNVYYPEYCIYEDNPLSMIYPLITNKFLKSDLVAYNHFQDFPSITRSKPNARYFDRLYTSIYGFNQAVSLSKNDNDLKLLEDRFKFLYLNTVSGLISVKPSRNWLIIQKVLKEYRKVTNSLNIRTNLLKDTPKKSLKYQTYFLFHWYLSYLNPSDSSKFFETQRLKAWGRPFDEQPSFKSAL